MAIAYAGISYELREVSLKNKPLELIEISPKATTPVLQIGDLVLEESLDIMQWAIAQHDPCGWKDLTDAQKDLTQKLINFNDQQFKQALDRYKYANRFPERSPESYRAEAEQFLQILEQHLSRTHFLISDRQTLADVAIFPFVRQFAYVDHDWFATCEYHHLRQWLTWHEASDLFAIVMAKYPVWTADQDPVII